MERKTTGLALIEPRQTYPPRGIADSQYDVPRYLNPTSFGPKPTENLSTGIPHHFAASSDRTVNRYHETTTTTIARYDTM